LASIEGRRQNLGMDQFQWVQRLGRLWASIDELPAEDFLAAMEKLVGELPEDDPVGLFEHASALDSTGHTELAVERYRRALARELPGQRRRRAVIQLASSLRALGQAEESVALLTAELAAASDDLDDAVRAFLALALTSVGREREAVAVSLTALAPHLVRYSGSLAAYAQQIAESPNS
jgi:thioredoxin-like negative regulator of GroEL